MDSSLLLQDSIPAITQKKHSHGRKLPLNHIPRPRNAFILFRTNFVQDTEVTPGVERDHRNISKIAGAVWRGMSPEDKMVWHKKALEEKEQHQAKYAPVLRREGVARRRVKQKLWEGIDSDNDEDFDGEINLELSMKPTVPAQPLVGLESFGTDEDDHNPYSSSADADSPQSWSSLSPPAQPTTGPPNADIPTFAIPSKKPRDRCEVIAELYARGLRGTELEAEVKKREEDGRKKRAQLVELGLNIAPTSAFVEVKVKVPKKAKSVDSHRAHSVANHDRTKRLQAATIASQVLRHHRSQPAPLATDSPAFFSAPSWPTEEEIFTNTPIQIFTNLASTLPPQQESNDAAESYRRRWKARSPSREREDSEVEMVVRTPVIDSPFESPIPRPSAPLPKTVAYDEEGPRSAPPSEVSFFPETTRMPANFFDRRLSISQPASPVVGSSGYFVYLPQMTDTYAPSPPAFLPPPNYPPSYKAPAQTSGRRPVQQNSVSKWDAACRQWEEGGMPLNLSVVSGWRMAGATTKRLGRVARVEEPAVNEAMYLSEQEASPPVCEPLPQVAYEYAYETPQSYASHTMAQDEHDVSHYVSAELFASPTSVDSPALIDVDHHQPYHHYNHHQHIGQPSGLGLIYSPGDNY